MRVIKAQLINEDDIRSCSHLAYRHYIPRIGREPAPMNADYRDLIINGFVHIGVTNTDFLIGFIVFYQEHDYMFIENVAVFPSFFGKGYGRRLIAFCEDEARRLRMPRVTLYTNEKMTENINMYVRLGYEEIERRFEDGFNRVYFEKYV